MLCPEDCPVWFNAVSRLGADPYFTIECEGEKVRSHTVDDSLNPEWEASVTFYRKNPHSDIRIEVCCI